jgi:sigma-B regulation protein RsbU (phosphoserine phosphatase)
VAKAGPRPRALVVGGALPGRRSGPLAAALETELVPVARLGERLGQATPFDLALLCASSSSVSSLRRALVALGPADHRVPVLVMARRGAQEGLRSALARHLTGPADAVVTADLGEEELLCRLRSALHVRSVLSELNRKNGELAALQSQMEGITRRMGEELRLAANVQRSLLPPPLRHSRMELAREFIPFREIGGDYYDLVPLGPDRFGLAIGDVMGKGVPAALLSANLKSALRSQLQEGAAPADEVVARVNHLYWQVTPKGRFASFFLALFDLGAGTLQYVNAGHHHPFVVRADGTVHELGDGGTVLGLAEHTHYDRHDLELRREDVLVFYSDGVTDRSSHDDDLYGVDRLKEAAVRNRADGARIILYTLLGEVQGWSGGSPPEDDLTLIVGKVR